MVVLAVRSQMSRAPESLRRSAADNLHDTNAAFEGALGGLEFQNHAARYGAALHHPLHLLASNLGKDVLAVEHARDISEINQLIGGEIFRARSGHVIGIDVEELVV